MIKFDGLTNPFAKAHKAEMTGSVIAQNEDVLSKVLSFLDEEDQKKVTQRFLSLKASMDARRAMQSTAGEALLNAVLSSFSITERNRLVQSFLSAKQRQHS